MEECVPAQVMGASQDFFLGLSAETTLCSEGFFCFGLDLVKFLFCEEACGQGVANTRSVYGSVESLHIGMAQVTAVNDPGKLIAL